MSDLWRIHTAKTRPPKVIVWSSELEPRNCTFLLVESGWIAYSRNSSYGENAAAKSDCVELGARAY
jgi:hypothetical protein